VRVRLTRRGDYAVRAMVTLARNGADQLTGAALAEATGIPGSYVPQVMSDLVRAGLVANRRGRAGGYRLARGTDEVSLLDIVEAAEGHAQPPMCVLRGGPCRGQSDGVCDVHDAFYRAEQAVFVSLSAVEEKLLHAFEPGAVKGEDCRRLLDSRT